MNIGPLLLAGIFLCCSLKANSGELLVQDTEDFEINGSGSSETWQNTKWIDRDHGQRAVWAWKPIKKHFHEYEKFGYIRFEQFDRGAELRNETLCVATARK